MLIYFGIGVIVFLITWKKYAYYFANRYLSASGQRIYKNTGTQPGISDYVSALFAVGALVIVLWPISIYFAKQIKIKSPEVLNMNGIHNWIGRVYDNKKKKIEDDNNSE